MEVMRVAILTVHMVMKSTHHHRSAGTATGRGRECIAEQRSIGRQRVDRGCDGNFIAIAPKRRTFVVGDKEDNVAVRTFRIISRASSAEQRAENRK